MIAYLLSKFVTLTYGLLYPAYCSYKAVKTKDVREYVNWMMYWISFAAFSVFEVFADTFVGCWFPFYYEGKILFLLWMISSSTRGGALLYRRYIHPTLVQHEQEIDACLADFKAKASNTFMKWCYRALSVVSEAVITATYRVAENPRIDNDRRTYSLNDLNRDIIQFIGAPRGPNQDGLDGFVPANHHLDNAVYERNLPIEDNAGDVEMVSATSQLRERSPAVVLISQESGESESRAPRTRSKTRNRKENSIYGTLPRNRRTAKKVEKNM